MIADNNPLITAAAVAAVVVGASVLAPSRKTATSERLSGVLYSIDADTQAARATAASMPEIDIGLDPAARAILPPASALVVRFVGIDESTFTLTLARRLRETATVAMEPPSATAAAAPKKHRHQAAKPVSKSKIVVSTTSAVIISNPAAAHIAPPPTAPKPTFPPTFAEIDDALRASSTVQAINVRVKKGGVTFRLTQVGRIENRYVVRYAIANEDSDTFFLSIVNVSADGMPIHSETAGPYSCPTGQEVYGVAHFPPDAVAGKKVVVELVQSGGEHRHFSLAVDYPF